MVLRLGLEMGLGSGQSWELVVMDRLRIRVRNYVMPDVYESPYKD